MNEFFLGCGRGWEWNEGQGSLPWDTVTVVDYHGVGLMHVGGGFVCHFLLVLFTYSLHVLNKDLH